jgi:hypothetical protein
MAFDMLHRYQLNLNTKLMEAGEVMAEMNTDDDTTKAVDTTIELNIPNSKIVHAVEYLYQMANGMKQKTKNVRSFRLSRYSIV